MSLSIPSPAGTLEAIYTPSDNPTLPLAIICHPHPQHGGSMTNKVVTTACKAMQQLGFATVIFNFRGVGKSTGEFDHQVGEIDDAMAVLNWVLEQGSRPIWMAGFSFGAYIAAKVANEKPDIVRQLLTLAPVLKHSDYSTLNSIQCPWHCIVGSDDEFVSVDELKAFQAAHSTPMSLEVIEPASHYFHGQLIPLRDLIVSHYAQMKMILN